jgi:hypothetical protein
MERTIELLCKVIKRSGMWLVSYKKNLKEYYVKSGRHSSLSIPVSEVAINKEEALGCLDNDDYDHVLMEWDREIEGVDNILVKNVTGWIENNPFGDTKTFDNFETVVSKPTFAKLLQAIVYTKCVKDEWSYEVLSGLILDDNCIKVKWTGDF